MIEKVLTVGCRFGLRLEVVTSRASATARELKDDILTIRLIRNNIADSQI